MIKSLENFRPYEGDGPYIFISYAHANDAAVLPLIADLNSRGYHVWYDDGIEPGSEWPECIAQHLDRASLVISCISNAYANSANCRKELHYALTRQKKVINIYLEQTALTPGLQLQLDNVFALMRYQMEDGVFYRKLYSAPLMVAELETTAQYAANAHEGSVPAPAVPAASVATAGKVKKAHRSKAQKPPRTTEQKQQGKRIARRVIALVLVVLLLGCGIAGAIVAYFTGYLSRLQLSGKVASYTPPADSTVCSFADAYVAEFARSLSGKEAPTVADLRGVTDLTLDASQLTTLADLAYFTELYSLTLRSSTGSGLSSLTTLPVCPVRVLDISGLGVASLQGVGNLPNLQVLNAADCPVSDIGDVQLCFSLTTLDLSGTRITDFGWTLPLSKLAEVSASGTTVSGLKQVLRHSSLRRLTVRDSDLSGRFFARFDAEDRMLSITLVNCVLTSFDELERFSSLCSLTLEGCIGYSDTSVLHSLPASTVVTVLP